MPRLITVILLFAVLILVPIHEVNGFPNGVGDIGEQGCLCHGAENDLTSVQIAGLPDKFESNTTYFLQLIVDNPQIDVNASSAQGGFRLVVSSGTISFNDTNTSQIIGDGWTHTELGNQQRIWNLTWQSPSDNTSLSALTLFGNAVNGNGEFTALTDKIIDGRFNIFIEPFDSVWKLKDTIKLPYDQAFKISPQYNKK